ncbi:hypothetical protein BS47DRAFT_1391895 [Hydnum rufescens UP504]|uniref:Uncharacterized protein n=1 Tax=Hydnum rufescens UP504 TaxID=1448309 RepID=A0A9P6DUA9_9AGAM|nr:hypothetical protein BS47DRAFT_1391895 [Hydnum rufescens UP504]
MLVAAPLYSAEGGGGGVLGLLSSRWRVRCAAPRVSACRKPAERTPSVPSCCTQIYGAEGRRRWWAAAVQRPVAGAPHHSADLGARNAPSEPRPSPSCCTQIYGREGAAAQVDRRAVGPKFFAQWA